MATGKYNGNSTENGLRGVMQPSMPEEEIERIEQALESDKDLDEPYTITPEVHSVGDAVEHGFPESLEKTETAVDETVDQVVDGIDTTIEKIEKYGAKFELVSQKSMRLWTTVQPIIATISRVASKFLNKR